MKQSRSKQTFRGYHYDIGRGAYLRPEVFKHALCLAAESGFTHFIPYLENMVRLPSMAKACPPCAYDAHTWRNFDAAAADAGIELVPHFNVIGHTRDICQHYPELVGMPGDHELDVTLEAVKTWTLACLNEYCAFSQGSYFLIGGDEWQCPDHLLAQPGFNVAAAWAQQMNLAVDFIVARGRIPIVWHDMLLHYPEAYELLSDQAVIAFWFYDEDSDYPVLTTLKKKFSVIMASGLCDGNLSLRRLRAVETSLQAMERHGVDDFMMTSWSDGRWEKQSANIPLIGRLLRGDALPPVIPETISLRTRLSLAQRIGDASAVASLQESALDALAHDAWDAFPLYRDLIALELNANAAALGEGFERFHVPEGPLYDAVRSGGPGRSKPRAARGPGTSTTERFGVEVDEDGSGEGSVLRIFNGLERVTLHPAYGACLSAWSIDGDLVIPSWSQEAWGEALPRPGGYHSYKRLRGLRPILALGVHTNPCILWQQPYTWDLVENSPERIVVRLHREFFHADVTYDISFTRGVSGFEYRPRGAIKLPECYAAWNFNCVLALDHSTMLDTAFEWTEGDRAHKQRLKEFDDTFFRIPARDALVVDGRDHAIRIEVDPMTSAGFFVDCSPGMATPDLHGIYQRVCRGDILETCWTFASVDRRGGYSAR